MNTIQDRVRELIQDSGVTQATFAQQLGMDPTKLSKSLNASRRFSSLDLALIADRCHVSVDFLVTGEMPDVARAARASVGSSSERALALADQYVTMRSDLASDGRTQEWRLPEPIALTGRWIDQGARLAARALAMMEEAGFGLEEPLWESMPTVFGIDVAVQDLGAGFDGLAVASEHARLIIANTSALPARQRFTIAHELGHLLASDDQQIHSDKDIYGPDAKTGESETRANAFAAAFLMPAELIRQTDTLDEAAFCSLATRLGVSPLALAYRLNNLGIIDEGTSERWRRISAVKAAERSGGSSQVPGKTADSLTVRAPASLLRDTFAAYEAGEITLRPYAGLLGVDTSILRRQLAQAEEG